MPHAGEFLTGPNILIRDRLRSVSPQFPLGYMNGAGGSVTQATSKSTAITLNASCGRVTMHAANLGANTAVSFTWTNSAFFVNDSVAWGQRAGTNGAYHLTFTPADGSCVVTLRNLTSGALAEAFDFNFAIIRGTVS